MFKPTMLKSKVRRQYKNLKPGGIDKKDMERKFGSAGPNKQMYEMYNMNMRNSAMNEPIGYFINNQNDLQGSNIFNNTSTENFNIVSDQNSKS